MKTDDKPALDQVVWVDDGLIDVCDRVLLVEFA